CYSAADAALLGAFTGRRKHRMTQHADRKHGSAHSLVPGFLYILILYIIGAYVFQDPRAPLWGVLGYKLSWVEVLITAAAIMAMAEQIKVAKPGINNTSDGLLMGLIAMVQVLLFALAA